MTVASGGRMCDDLTEQDNAAALSRRQFTALTATAALAAFLPTGAFAGALTETEVSIKTPDGKADAYFVHPAGVKSPAVLIWPDILGLRPSFRAMGKRLAAEGFAVLVVNPFYRSAKAPVVSPGDTFKDPAIRERVLPFAKALSASTHTMDAKAFVDFLDASDAVDPTKGIGTSGYCMGGPMVFRTASSRPDRIRAGATFHGGGLVTEDADSPHRGMTSMKAALLVAIAENDDARDPDAKRTLAASAKAAGLEAEIEVYPGTLHGWCPPDSPVHHKEQSEKAWMRLLALFKAALS